jgi:hypothetical protein
MMEIEHMSETTTETATPNPVARLFVWGWCVCDVENGEGVEAMLGTEGEAMAYVDRVFGPADAHGVRTDPHGHERDVDEIVIFPGISVRDDDEARMLPLLAGEIDVLGPCPALAKRDPGVAP